VLLAEDICHKSRQPDRGLIRLGFRGGCCDQLYLGRVNRKLPTLYVCQELIDVDEFIDFRLKVCGWTKFGGLEKETQELMTIPDIITYEKS
jgi:hypothetical protein